MGKEIERKFLVVGDGWLPLIEREMVIEQGYLVDDGIKNVRVRIIYEGGDIKSVVTIKSCNAGMTRDEYEFDIDYKSAVGMMTLASEGFLKKTRFVVPYKGNDWEVDVFPDLTIAELELESEDQEFETPDWVGEEVTHLKEYYNTELSKRNWV